MSNPNGYYDIDRANRNYNTGVAGTPGNGDAAGTMNHTYSHVGNTAEYLASGYPFFCNIATGNNVTFAVDKTGTGSAGAQALDDGDVISVAFPYVSRWLMVKGFKNGAAVANDVVYVGVSRTGVGSGSTDGPCQADLSMIAGEHLEMKCSKLFFRIKDVSECTHIQIVAGLTNILAEDFIVETSANTNIGVDKIAAISGTHNHSASGE